MFKGALDGNMEGDLEKNLSSSGPALVQLRSYQVQLKACWTWSFTLNLIQNEIQNNTQDDTQDYILNKFQGDIQVGL